ncbi:hypothetical protein G3I51_24445 [Streptomyces sp. SID9944]|nr:hypothetical protein [Streptomyces sp. SID9944]
MPTTDSYGQGIGLWQMTDAPSIPDAIALFAKGVLPRLTLTFASASARGSTLVGSAAPVPGMMTWLTDVQRMDMWDGTSWVTVSVGSRTWTTITLASGWSQNGASQGNLQYRIVNFAGEDTIMFRGGISRSTYPNTMPDFFTINANVLPTTARPTTIRTILLPCSDVSSDRIALKMDITVDGKLNIYGGPNAKPPWISFNGTFASL